MLRTTVPQPPGKGSVIGMSHIQKAIAAAYGSLSHNDCVGLIIVNLLIGGNEAGWIASENNGVSRQGSRYGRSSQFSRISASRGPMEPNNFPISFAASSRSPAGVPLL